MIVSIIRRRQTLDGSQPSRGLILQKDQGGLNKSSDSTVQIYLESEKRIQKMLLVTGQQPPRGSGIPVALSYVVLEKLGGRVFDTLEDHLKDMEPDNNHVYPLIKAVYQARLHQNTHAPPDKTTQRTDHWKGRSQRNSQAQSFQTSVSNCTVSERRDGSRREEGGERERLASL